MAEIIMTLPAPATRPAVAPKTFNEIYILDLVINARGMDGHDTIYVNYCPFDKATGERLLTDQRELRLPFWQTVETVPEAAAAFAAVAAAIPALISALEA